MKNNAGGVLLSTQEGHESQRRGRAQLAEFGMGGEVAL